MVRVVKLGSSDAGMLPDPLATHGADDFPEVPDLEVQSLGDWLRQLGAAGSIRVRRLPHGSSTGSRARSQQK
jgi:hypothetical protein